MIIKSVTKNISYLNSFQPTSLFFHKHIPSFFSNCSLFCILAVQISEEVGVAAAASHTHTHTPTLLSHSHTQRAKPRLDGCLSGGERWERGSSFHSDSSPWRQSPRPPHPAQAPPPNSRLPVCHVTPFTPRRAPSSCSPVHSGVRRQLGPAPPSFSSSSFSSPSSSALPSSSREEGERGRERKMRKIKVGSDSRHKPTF